MARVPITVEVPEDTLLVFGRTPELRQQRVLEAAVLEYYRVGELSQAECSYVLGISRMEFVEMVSERQIAHPGPNACRPKPPEPAFE